MKLLYYMMLNDSSWFTLYYIISGYILLYYIMLYYIDSCYIIL